MTKAGHQFFILCVDGFSLLKKQLSANVVLKMYVKKLMQFLIFFSVRSLLQVCENGVFFLRI